VRIVICVTWLSLVSTTAIAQTWEVGGSVASACLGSDGSLCGSGTHPLIGVHASWWIDDRFEISMRAARVAVPSFEFEAVDAGTVRITDRSQGFLSAMFIYHFAHEQRVRPILGLGTGAIARSERVLCEPSRCSEMLGLPPEGPPRKWMKDVILIAGLSGTATPRWVWRAGWLSHRFGNDENSTNELFAAIGYRFGRR
jgi:hypothetical protein